MFHASNYMYIVTVNYRKVKLYLYLYTPILYYSEQEAKVILAAQAGPVRGREESSGDRERNRGFGAVGPGNHEGN
jgi:hypothetical protein